MLQWRLYESTGNDALTLIKDAEQPKIKTPTEVLVKIHALSLNARDNQFTSGTYALKVPKGGAVVTSGEQYCI
jgi:NADPH:quinone reductase-like Zn-dependent oxidoreductase